MFVCDSENEVVVAKTEHSVDYTLLKNVCTLVKRGDFYHNVFSLIGGRGHSFYDILQSFLFALW